MQPLVQEFYAKRLEETAEALRGNNFTAFVVQTAAQARDLILGELIPQAAPATVSMGGSVSLFACGVVDAVKALSGVEFIDTTDPKAPREVIVERRRQALLCDVFLTGTNAVTEQGVLVNLDALGNRVAALTFGPRQVIVLAGRNKLAPDEYAAMERVRDLAGPVNAKRLGRKTPCAKTLRCQDCNSPERICNTWTITRKSFPKGRTTVVLVNEDLGF